MYVNVAVMPSRKMLPPSQCGSSVSTPATNARVVNTPAGMSAQPMR